MTDALHGQLRYHLDVVQTVVLLGRATNGVTVHRGGHLLLHGHVQGDVRVKAGGRATVYGTVAGDVIAESGGSALVSGAVSGRLDGEVTVRLAAEPSAQALAASSLR
jgi:hypothetical protein